MSERPLQNINDNQLLVASDKDDALLEALYRIEELRADIRCKDEEIKLLKQLLDVVKEENKKFGDRLARLASNP